MSPQENTFEKSLWIVLMAVFAAFTLADTAASLPTESQRATLNKKIVSCYAELAGAVYEDSQELYACRGTTATSSQDPRNGMGRWERTWPYDLFEQHLDVWQRISSDGTLKEMAFVYRGSVDVQDWLRNADSQLQPSERPMDLYISNLGSSPTIINYTAKFAKGFLDRVADLDSDVNFHLAYLEAWQAANPNGRIGVKVAGHSLGAAAATIAGLYIADRFHFRDDAYVEVFAFNSPKVANLQMQYQYRRAATSCKFNLHVFNNADDVVSAVPSDLNRPHDRLYQISGHYPSSDPFPSADCAHLSAFSSDPELFKGIHFPRLYNHWFKNIADPVGEYILEKHAWQQWVLEQSGQSYLETLQSATDPVASKWIALTPIGGEQVSVPERSDTRSGSLTANLYSNSHNRYLRAKHGGGSDVRADRSSPGTHERFELIPGNNRCIRHGSSIIIKTHSGGHYFRATTSGGLDARAGEPKNWETFSVINHTSEYGCIKYNDVISLRAHTGKYVVAESGGTAKADRAAIGPWEKFTVRKP